MCVCVCVCVCVGLFVCLCVTHFHSESVACVVCSRVFVSAIEMEVVKRRRFESRPLAPSRDGGANWARGNPGPTAPSICRYQYDGQCRVERGWKGGGEGGF